MQYIADADPGTDFYYAVVRLAHDWDNVVSNCQHKHRTRESAERCAEKLAAKMRRAKA